MIGVAVLCVAIAAFAAAYFAFTPKPAAGSKTIQVEIVADAVDSNKEVVRKSKIVTIQTDAEFLRQALEEQDLIQGDESEFGLFIKTVDGITADDSNQEWWCVTKGGEQVMTGVDATPIADGDHYEITLTVGY